MRTENQEDIGLVKTACVGVGPDRGCEDESQCRQRAGATLKLSGDGVTLPRNCTELLRPGV